MDTPGTHQGARQRCGIGGRQGRAGQRRRDPDGGTVRRGLPYNVFWDVDDAAESVEKMVASADVFYPGHDRPFTLAGDSVGYLEGPIGMEVTGYVEGGAPSAMTYVVHPTRETQHRPRAEGLTHGRSDAGEYLALRLEQAGGPEGAQRDYLVERALGEEPDSAVP